MEFKLKDVASGHLRLPKMGGTGVGTILLPMHPAAQPDEGQNAPSAWRSGEGKRSDGDMARSDATPLRRPTQRWT